MEYGLPPTAGWGVGVDRLTMFLSDKVKSTAVSVSSTKRFLLLGRWPVFFAGGGRGLDAAAAFGGTLMC